MDKKIEISETLKRVNHLANNVSHTKVLFGTDYPMQDYETTKIFAQPFIKKKTE